MSESQLSTSHLKLRKPSTSMDRRSLMRVSDSSSSSLMATARSTISEVMARFSRAARLSSQVIGIRVSSMGTPPPLRPCRWRLFMKAKASTGVVGNVLLPKGTTSPRRVTEVDSVRSLMAWSRLRSIEPLAVVGPSLIKPWRWPAICSRSANVLNFCSNVATQFAPQVTAVTTCVAIWLSSTFVKAGPSSGRSPLNTSSVCLIVRTLKAVDIRTARDVDLRSLRYEADPDTFIKPPIKDIFTSAARSSKLVLSDM
mmetsp:Transcript_551/g.1525  ORF Transcript_551/g.1525 Transcript_551/m.1525 type:complete len:255 (+) Transcript_551:2460-3224(+)